MSLTLRAKRMFIGAVAGAMALSLMPAGIASADIDDVCENAPDAGFADAGITHADNINCLVAYGIAQGRTATEFGTSMNLTRGQAATLFVNFAVVATDGEIADEVDEDLAVPFTDISGTTHEANIETLFQLGLIQGTTATTYSPNAHITRAQFATILYNAHVALGVEFDDTYPNPFDDTAGSVHVDAISALAGEGIISGTTTTTYSPSDPVLRGQTATLLMQSAGLLDELGIWAAPRLEDDAPLQDLTDAPELLQVTLQQEFATSVRYAFEFDGPISSEGLDPDLFYLNAWDGSYQSATQVIRDDSAVDGTSNRVVRAVFPKVFSDHLTHKGNITGGVATWQDATTASVLHDAVEDLNTPDLVNPEGSFGIRSVTLEAGRTQWPDLLEVTNFSTTNNTADFVFDSTVTGLVANANTNADAFGLVLRGDTVVAEQDAGQYEVRGTAVAGVTGQANVLRVTFEDINHDPDFLTTALVNEVRRGYVLDGVWDDSTDPTSPNTAGIITSTNVADNGATLRPDLVGVTIQSATQALFEFDEPVRNVGGGLVFDENDFWVNYYNGLSVSAVNAERAGPGATGVRQVLVTFDAGVLTDAVVGFATRNDAAESTGNATRSEAATYNVSQTFARGETLAPSLQDVQIEVSNIDAATGAVIAYEVTYLFDRPVASAGINDDLTLYDEDGGRRVADANGPGCTIAPTAALANAIICTGSSATGGFTLLGAQSAVLGGLEDSVVENNPQHPNEDTEYNDDEIVNYETSVPVTRP